MAQTNFQVIVHFVSQDLITKFTYRIKSNYYRLLQSCNFFPRFTNNCTINYKIKSLYVPSAEFRIFKSVQSPNRINQI